MDSSLSRHQTRVFAVVVLLCSLALFAPWPGSLSVVVTRSLTSGFEASFGEALSTVALLLLAVGAATTAALAWFRSPGRSIALVRSGLVGGGFGVVLAYAASEGLKALFQQPRPCAAWNLQGPCPPAGDWSLPSNHATLAFAAVVVIALATRSLWATVIATAVALLVAIGRMMEGMHYLHDVALGALLGGGVTLVCAVLATGVRRRLQSQPAVRLGGPH